MKIELNAYLLQPLAWVKCYCIKQASSYWSFLEAKNSLYLWLFLTSPPFHPLEKIIRQPLCCSTSTEKLECARPSPQAFWTKHPGCTAMPWKKPSRKEKYDTKIILKMNIIFRAVTLLQWHIWQPKLLDMFRTSGLGDLTGSLRLEGGGVKG